MAASPNEWATLARHAGKGRHKNIKRTVKSGKTSTTLGSVCNGSGSIHSIHSIRKLPGAATGGARLDMYHPVSVSHFHPLRSTGAYRQIRHGSDQAVMPQSGRNEVQTSGKVQQHHDEPNEGRSQRWWCMGRS
jgi:hypothetical protein